MTSSRRKARVTWFREWGTRVRLLEHRDSIAPRLVQLKGNLHREHESTTSRETISRGNKCFSQTIAPRREINASWNKWLLRGKVTVRWCSWGYLQNKSRSGSAFDMSGPSWWPVQLTRRAVEVGIYWCGHLYTWHHRTGDQFIAYTKYKEKHEYKECELYYTYILY